MPIIQLLHMIKKTLDFPLTCCTCRHVLCWPEAQTQGAVGVLLLLVH